jgi:hypothetical protein
MRGGDRARRSFGSGAASDLEKVIVFAFVLVLESFVDYDDESKPSKGKEESGIPALDLAD